MSDVKINRKHALETRKGERPTIQPVRLDSIPESLRSLRRWVFWSYKWRFGKWTKVPERLSSVGLMTEASCTDPDTWRDFAFLAARVNRRVKPEDKRGLGFVLAEDDNHTGIDLDNSRDPDTGEIALWAQPIIDALSSYTEVSPSGTGVKVIVRGHKPGRRCKNAKLGVEMYDADRYFTVTGDRVPGTPAEVAERQDVIDRLYAEWFPEPEQTTTPDRPHCDTPPASLSLSDTEIIDRATSAANGIQFAALWSGDTSAYDNDDSRADFALASMLAFWCGPDAHRITRLMWQSGLVRGKWHRDGYLADTVARAMTGRMDYYGSGNGNGQRPRRLSPELEAELSGLAALPIRHLVRGVEMWRTGRWPDDATGTTTAATAPPSARPTTGDSTPPATPATPATPLPVGSDGASEGVPFAESLASLDEQRSPAEIAAERAAAAARAATIDAAVRAHEDAAAAFACSRPSYQLVRCRETCRPVVMLCRCKCWRGDCEGCRRLFMHRHIENARHRFREAADAGHLLYVLDCDQARWRATHARITARDGSFFRLADVDPVGDPIFAVITTARVPGSIPLADIDDAVQFVRRTLDDYAGDAARVITSSRDWALPHDEDDAEPAYEHVCACSPSLNRRVLDDIIAEADATALRRRYADSLSVVSADILTRDDGFDEERWDHLRSMVESGESWPFWIWQHRRQQQREAHARAAATGHDAAFCDEAASEMVGADAAPAYRTATTPAPYTLDDGPEESAYYYD